MIQEFIGFEMYRTFRTEKSQKIPPHNGT
jgi:hypothetical protein